METFNRDLERGKTVERLVLKEIKKQYPSALIIQGKFKPYDIWIPEIGKSIEVKSDMESLKTGNFLVEIEMFNKPSALLTTSADYWVFYDGLQFVWITPQKILEVILLNNLRWTKFIGKGDTAYKKAYLIKKKMIIDNANLIKKK